MAPFDPRHQLGRDEPLGVGLKRVTMDQLELAASGYFEGEEHFEAAIRQSGVAIERVRALLRLARSELPEKVFRLEDQGLSDTGNLVAGVASASAVVVAARLIRELYGELLAEATFMELVATLERRWKAAEERALEDPYLAERVVRNLERAYHRYASWPTDPEAREAYGMGIRDAYGAIEPGLEATYRRGRDGMVGAYSTPTPEAFGSWAQGVRYLRHQMEFLVPLWPEVLVGVVMTLDRLGMVLDEDQDLSALVGLLIDRPDLCPNPRERSLVRALVEQRRHELHLAAEILGRRVYAEKPAALVSRFGEYWDSRRQAIGASLDTLVVY